MVLHPVRTYRFVHWSLLLLAGVVLQLHCKKIYAPPAITVNNRFLVVDGIINTGAASVTQIRLDRTRNLGDSSSGGIPEPGAQVMIMAGSGVTYPLKDIAGDGLYSSDPLTLDPAQSYKIVISTADNRKYASDPVLYQRTPAIDSVYYNEPGDFTVYVDSHDPSGNTRFYRWDYTETYEHDAQLMSPWIVVNGLVIPSDSSNQHTNCYTTINSTKILLGTSEKLSQDVISRFPIRVIANGDPMINQKYSILVRQYALTRDAWNYWSLVQKTSQQLGTLFDVQPSQLIGNIHCLTNPGEPVIGFMSASSIEEQRIFVYQSELLNWIHNPPEYQCDTREVPVDPVDYRIYSETDSNFAPYFFRSTAGPLVLASTKCLNCLLFGGTNQKPPYWK
jgi:Domain of unknown function (DUF4249)